MLFNLSFFLQTQNRLVNMKIKKHLSFGVLVKVFSGSFSK